MTHGGRGIKYRALDAFVRHRRNNATALAELKVLATDVYAGRVSDPDDDLLGCLLTKLYPDALSTREVIQYLRPSMGPNHRIKYEYFWRVHLPEKSTYDQLAGFLDQFVQRYEQLPVEVESYQYPVLFLRRLPLVVLSRLLDRSQDDIELNRLFDWLGAATWIGDWEHQEGTSLEEEGGIRRWLESRTEVRKSLLLMGLNRCVGVHECTEPSEFDSCMWMEEQRRLFSAEWPTDFGLWCLDQALTAEDRHAAKWFVRKVASCMHSRCHNEGLSQKVVEGRLAGNSVLGNMFGERMSELEERTTNERALEEKGQVQKKAEQREWHDRVKPHEEALYENRAKPALLHKLATAYFGGYIDIEGDTPKDRLGSLVDDDENLVQAVLAGFRGTIRRNDLPTDAEVMRLGTHNEIHHLSLPFMAGLEEIGRTAPAAGEIGLDATQIGLALAIHYTVPMWPRTRHPADRPQSWLPSLLTCHPEIVADVLVRSARSKLRNGADSAAGVHELAHSPDHSNVACLAALPLLTAFPVRCTERQLPTLNHLLRAACLHCEAEPFHELIDRKLAHRSMNVAQQVYWLVAGLCVSPKSYLEKLESYAIGSERRTRFLAEAMAGQYDFSRALSQHHRVPALQLLIRLIGSSCRPYSHDPHSEAGGMVTPAMGAADRVRGFIDQLASIPSGSASTAFEALLSDEYMHPWRPLLVDAKYRQNASRRETSFIHCNIGQIIDTLDNRRPANAADLAALTFEHICEISRNIRDGNASGWRQYWNVDSYNRPMDPKPEEACRDALLSALQDRLTQLGIDAQPEGRYADDKRSDIRVYHDGCNVPVEIKKSCHRDLWSAIGTQLLDKYTRDPGAEGFGIYLVFWFGNTEHCRPAAGPGFPPSSAVELGDRLRGTLSAEEMLKIRICVIDVAISGV